MTDARKKKWLRFYFDETHGSTQGEKLLVLIDGVREEAFEEAARYMDRRAGEISANGGSTAITMARIFSAEAEAIRALRTKP